MTHITVLGGTGYAGRNIAAEAASRGHEVQAVARRAPETQLEGVGYVTGDATSEEFLEDIVSKTEVVILALAPRGDMQGRVAQVAVTLIPIAARHGVRLGVIGGAGSLRVSEDGPRLIDTDAFPAEFKQESQELIQVLEDLRDTQEPLDWFYVSPAAGFGGYNPGTRQGTYRTAGDVMITDDAGKSDLSGADLGLAVIDEVEAPKHRNSRFAVAY